ncbi:MAG: methylenetetrahydrofolate reductase [Planctomycetota bacterium]|nr:methylenetetrahydrofolate reductase [Planctomycetota bacterium]
MKVIEHLQNASRPLISFEIIPPMRGGNLQKLMKLVEDLAEHRPPFIDITSHAAEVVFEETRGGYQRRIKRKRPGTLGVCALIQNKYGIDAVPHVLCQGFTRQETEDFLIELRYLGIDNVLAIRGDDSGYVKELKEGRTRNVHASDLVAQIARMNRGDYLEDLLDADPTNFCVGVAGYPEKHFEAPNIHTDIRWVKKKVEAGAEYVVTQMFFNNEHYFRFVDECRAAGIDVPIIPGIKLLTTPRHLTSIPRTFHCEIPEALADEIAKAPDGKVRPVGVEWGLMQARELLDKGVPSVHFYVMSSSKAINELLAQLDV